MYIFFFTLKQNALFITAILIPRVYFLNHWIYYQINVVAYTWFDFNIPKFFDITEIVFIIVVIELYNNV